MKLMEILVVIMVLIEVEFKKNGVNNIKDIVNFVFSFDILIVID